MKVVLVPIGGGLRLSAGTARAWFALVKAVRASTGRTLYLRNPYGAWRSWAMQAFLRTRYLTGRGKYPYALPAGKSNHEDGRAFDIANYVGVEKHINAAAKRLGLVRDRFEPWHYNFVLPEPVTKPALITLIPLAKKEAKMRILYNKDKTVPDNVRRALVGEFTFQIISAAETIRERKLWGSPVNVTPGEWAATKLLVEQRRASAGQCSSVAPVRLAD